MEDVQAARGKINKPKSIPWDEIDEMVHDYYMKWLCFYVVVFMSWIMSWVV